MLLTFKSKPQMRLYYPLEMFEPWPKDTFSFCPKCGLDNFEMLLDWGLERYMRCNLCGSLWIAHSQTEIEGPIEAVPA